MTVQNTQPEKSNGKPDESQEIPAFTLLAQLSFRAVPIKIGMNDVAWIRRRINADFRRLATGKGE